MAKLTAEMKEAFSNLKIFPVATASKDGIPNVVPIGTIEIISDDTIWIADNFMKKSLENLKENPKIALYLWSPATKGCFQIKGHATVKTHGKDFDKMKTKSNRRNPALPARSLIIVKIEDVFECQPGPRAGAKLL